MITVGVRELKQRASQLVRMVREQGGEVQITYRGAVVALLIPARRAEPGEGAGRAWMELDHLAAQIGARWPAGLSAAEAVAEGRQ